MERTRSLENTRVKNIEKRTEGTLDVKRLGTQVDVHLEEAYKLQAIGEKYVTDVKQLNARMEYLKDSDLSEESKEEIREEILQALAQVDAKYDTDVVAAMETIQAKITEDIELMNEGSTEAGNIAREIKSFKSEAGVVETTKAEAAAEKKKEEFTNMALDSRTKQEALRELNRRQLREERQRLFNDGRRR